MRQPEFSSTELIKEGYEVIHAMYDYEINIEFYRGSPIIGVADFNKEPYFYQCLFDETKNEWTTNFILKPLDKEIFSLCIKGWEIKLRWGEAFRLKQTTIDTFPALPLDKARYEEIKEIVKMKLEKSSDKEFVANGVFKVCELGYFAKWDKI